MAGPLSLLTEENSENTLHRLFNGGGGGYADGGIDGAFAGP